MRRDLVLSISLLLVPAAVLVAGPVLAQGGVPGEAPATSDDVASRRLRVVRKSTPAFGTTVQVMAAAHTDVDARLVAAHFETAFEEIRRIDRMLDASRESSPLAKLNREAGIAPIAVEPEVFQLLTEAVRVAKLSQGAFDPTFAAFTGVWRFSSEDPVPPAVSTTEADGGTESPTFTVAPGSPPSVPPPALREALQPLVNYRELDLDPAARTAFLRKPGMRVGLGGLGKGYALDRAAALLEGRGVTDFVIAAGGDLVVRGDKGGEPWMVGVQDPRAPGHFAAFPAQPGAVMTTGDYERSFFEGDVRYHHIVDPRTGSPARGTRSVTVLAGDGLSADALSTAVFVLGPKDGMKLVERLGGRAEAVIVTDENKVMVSPGLRDTLRYRPPTDAP